MRELPARGPARQPETFYPLHVRICDNCLLVQLPAYVAADDVFSRLRCTSRRTPTRWVEHARRFVGRRCRSGSTSAPRAWSSRWPATTATCCSTRWRSASRCSASSRPRTSPRSRNEKGIRTESYFLGEETGTRSRAGTAGPTWSSATTCSRTCRTSSTSRQGLRALVKDDGLVTLEFPHLLRLIERRQYDTIYHEHFSYLTLHDRRPRAGEGRPAGGRRRRSWPAHGGSLRVMLDAGRDGGGAVRAGAQGAEGRRRTPACTRSTGHEGFAKDVFAIKARPGRASWCAAAPSGKTVAGYGAPGKGNTLLNHCGIREDLLPYTVDRSPHKHGMFLPGTHIPIHAPERLAETAPRLHRDPARGTCARRSSTSSATHGSGARSSSSRSRVSK